MANWMGMVWRLGLPMEAGFDRVRQRLGRRAAERNGVQIVPYHGFGNGEVVRIKGRVLRATQAGPCNEGDGLWRNVLATYRRFNTREVPRAKVNLKVDGVRHSTVSDAEGYFEFAVPHHGAPGKTGWKSFELSDGRGASTDAAALIANGGAKFGVISDIDDTVVVTNARHFLKMARTVFLRNARGRVAFPGVAALFRALQEGTTGGEFNPIFYVSSGPWNLYDLLVDFFELNGIPAGPLLLQDFGLEERKVVAGSHREHKLAQIRLILRTYPRMPFILVGDSGQHDPEIYAEALREARNRIPAVYIRDVSGETREEEIRKLAAEAREHGGDFLLVKDSMEAARHAARKGFILEGRLGGIGEEKAGDERRKELEAG